MLMEVFYEAKGGQWTFLALHTPEIAEMQHLVGLYEEEFVSDAVRAHFFSEVRNL